MSHELPPNALVLTGPTAAGKTELALELAGRLDGEIVAVDSMTLYRGLDIGTAKPTPAEQARVRHHLLDVLEPWESASVAWWREQALAACADITARGKRPLLVGGSGLYLKSLLFGLFDGPPADLALRQRLTEEAEQTSRDALHARLAQVDSATAARLHANDVRRVVRALEVWELTGRPISAWQEQWKEEPRRELSVWWLDVPRTELYARIDARVLRMVEGGLVEEVRALLRRERPLSREARQALGYKEMIDHLEGRATLAEVIAQIQLRSRNFAKRQVTWFRHLPGCRAIGADELRNHAR